MSTSRARSLRRRSTRAETILWLALRDRRLAGCKFVRQGPVGGYYVDFVCRERHLVVEVDGGQHANNDEDRVREARLAAAGYSVIRIWNNEVIENLDGVLEMLTSALGSAPHPVPLPVNGARGRR